MLFDQPTLAQLDRDRTRDARLLDAARLTQAWREPNNRKPADLSDSPLFGGERQAAMFDEEEGQ